MSKWYFAKWLQMSLLWSNAATETVYSGHQGEDNKNVLFSALAAFLKLFFPPFFTFLFARVSVFPAEPFTVQDELDDFGQFIAVLGLLWFL